MTTAATTTTTTTTTTASAAFATSALAALSVLQPFSLSGFCADAPRANARPDTRPDTRPNIIYILADDMGYSDIGPFGSKKNRTPNLDRMAAEGLKLACFYAAPLCSPSRAQGMTGCYAKRVSVPNVLMPVSATGISASEHTVAELLKAQGYATACIGKWHLGDQPEFLPANHGFDSYFGLPYSNDMTGQSNARKAKEGKPPTPPLPLVRDTKAIEVVTTEGQDHLEERYTEAAVAYIRARAAAALGTQGSEAEASRSQPFFLYFAHTAVHKPLHPGPNFKGKSANGVYGDWVEEIDWSVGRVFDTLREMGLDKNTLVIYSSDNGPHQLAAPEEGGEAGPLRGAKGSTFEGGLRVPTLAWWPGKIPAGATSNAMTGSIDLLPTLVKIAGGSVPADNKIDGVDISPVLFGRAKESARKEHYYYNSNTLEAVRSGPWKLALVSQNERKRDIPYKPDPKFVPHLYNLETDIGERHDVAAKNPAVVKRLLALAAAMEKELGVKGKLGPGVRAPGRVGRPVGLWVAGQAPSKENIEEHYD